MSILPIRLYGDPVLRQKSAEVAEFDDDLRRMVADMRETMRAYNGVGLAANQIGVPRRVLVVEVPIGEEQRVQYTMVNPVILSRSGSETDEEGCLSMPGIYEDVTRAEHVVVEAKDEHGRAYKLQADGYLSRAIQHEVDHLDGVLFTDRLSILKRQFLKRALEALERGELPEDYERPAAPGNPASL